MVEMTGAKALIHALEKEGVDIVFGLPGGANLPIYDALVGANLRHILVRHEQSAAHMADGYARIKRKSGVCFATSGPGATNIITGLATAHADSIPMVAVTGQVALPMIGKDAFQETDIIGIANPCTKYSFQPRAPGEIPEMVKKAFYIAESGRPGPVLVDIPKDVQQATADMKFPDLIKVRGYNPVIDADLSEVGKAVELILKAERPIIMAGGGVILSGAFAELQTLAELLMIPVVTTFKGKGAFPENHPLAMGPIGMHGHAEANKIIIEADCIIAIGARFSDRSVGRFDEFGKGMSIIHMDIDPAEIGKNKSVDVAIVGDVKSSLRTLVKLLTKKVTKKDPENPWLRRKKELVQYFAENLKDYPREITAKKSLKKLRELLPAQGIVTTEVGQCQMWASLHFDVIAPGTFFSSTGLGTMGFGFPASIGAKAARPEVPVVDIAGDGSFNMTENSLAVSVIEKLPVIVFLMNNYMLGMVAQWQRTFYNRRYSGVHQHHCPDYVKVAEAYGAQGIRAQSMAELEKAIKTAIKSDVATVIDIPIDPDEDVYPFVAPGTSLKDMITGG
ncbi:biosynthetic-type acetolactate synthase large subunit [Nitrososphaera viennensis]|uniref:Acetolactate synthase n=2 Tax=Nitrososphaera viennensis TaxID=1034015 RepID=A0A060HND7_9ARCH|nr:biosynthetic-type acetolactate synthase large subunit [Nitrososphaera viennensis]AIC15076.1 acetolactate synthase, large subunit [Nitrososphaera viennensis EN76]UVS70003.1 biosynthetic-type acetolactate synthase large subunit [Nitrososphaera viennensis]